MFEHYYTHAIDGPEERMTNIGCTKKKMSQGLVVCSAHESRVLQDDRHVSFVNTSHKSLHCNLQVAPWLTFGYRPSLGGALRPRPD